jgi:hypothetical protein
MTWENKDIIIFKIFPIPILSNFITKPNQTTYEKAQAS